MRPLAAEVQYGTAASSCIPQRSQQGSFVDLSLVELCQRASSPVHSVTGLAAVMKGPWASLKTGLCEKSKQLNIIIDTEIAN